MLKVTAMDLGELTIEKATELEGTTFEVTMPDGAVVPMKLDEATPFEVRQRRRPRPTETPKRTPFALYFLGPPSPVYPQGTYTFRSEGLSFEGLFIVPVSQDEQAVEYEAVFN
jgi:hypothetical protein